MKIYLCHKRLLAYPDSNCPFLPVSICDTIVAERKMEKWTKATVKAVCISRAKGTPKEPVPHIDLIEDYGIEGDAHAGKWHRQVSLLSYETIENFKAEMAGASPLVTDGSFGENIIIEGIDFKNLSVGTKLQIGQTGAPDHPDRQGVSQPVHYRTDRGTVHHAGRRRLCPGADGRQGGTGERR